jgi:DNA-binding response OmpR family regulator
MTNLPKLLIIDDQPESISLLMNFLGERDFDIAVALDGEDGMTKARLLKPDLILLDIVMPRMDGFETCRKLKADATLHDIPVIFLSGHNDVAEKLAGFSAGGQDYITKPFEAEEVLARIWVHLQSAKRIARLESMVARQRVGSLVDEVDRDQHFFSSALDILDAQIADPPGLQELAHRVGTNERKLTELFRQKVNMTVFEYLTELRMESSRALLEKSDLQIKLIAEKVGYRNAGDYSRAFRQRYKITPREYRLTRRGSDVVEED